MQGVSMNTLEHPNDLRDGAPLGSRLRPGHLSLFAFGVGLFALLLSLGHDQCSDYTGKSFLNGLVVVALITQGGSLVYAIARCVQRIPRAGRGLLVAIATSVLAVPGALFVAIAINGLLCGW